MLIEQMNDAEGKMTMFTSAKAVSIQQAEEKCQRYKVGHDVCRNHLQPHPR